MTLKCLYTLSTIAVIASFMSQANAMTDDEVCDRAINNEMYAENFDAMEFGKRLEECKKGNRQQRCERYVNSIPFSNEKDRFDPEDNDRWQDFYDECTGAMGD